MELATSLSDRIAFDVKSVYSNERLLDGDNSNINQLDGTVVILSWTFNSNYVTNTDAKAQEVLLVTVLVECTIDIDLTSLILQIPVTISSVGNALNSTLHTIGLAVNAILGNLLTGRERNVNLLGNLLDINLLLLTVTQQFQESSARLCGLLSLEDHVLLTCATTCRGYGKPFWHIFKLPVTIGLQRYRCLEFLIGRISFFTCCERDNGLRYLYLTQCALLFVFRTADKHSHGRHEHRDNISKFHICYHLSILSLLIKEVLDTNRCIPTLAQRVIGLPLRGVATD